MLGDEAVQEATGEKVTLVDGDGGYSGATAMAAAADQGIELEIVKVPDITRGTGW